MMMKFKTLISYQLSNMKYHISYRHHAIQYIPKTYLFYNQKFVLFDHLYSFLPLSTIPSYLHSSVYSLCLWDFLFVLFLRYNIQVRANGIYVSLSDLFHLAWCLSVHSCYHKWQYFGFFVTEWQSLIDIHIYHIFLIYSFMNEHLDCSHILAVVYSADMNMGESCISSS